MRAGGKVSVVLAKASVIELPRRGPRCWGSPGHRRRGTLQDNTGHHDTLITHKVNLHTLIALFTV